MNAVWYHSFGKDHLLVLENSKRSEASVAMYDQTAMLEIAAVLPCRPQAPVKKTATCTANCARTAASSRTTIVTSPRGLVTAIVDLVWRLMVGWSNAVCSLRSNSSSDSLSAASPS